MAEVTYYVALPFVASDDGIAAGDPNRDAGRHRLRSRFVAAVIVHEYNRELVVSGIKPL